MSPMASLVAANKKQQSFSVFMNVYNMFLLPFDYCILLEI